jgi:hypothetical protein
MGVSGQRYAPAALPPGKRPGTHYIGGSVGLWTGVENLAPTGFRSPDRPGRSESTIENLRKKNKFLTFYSVSGRD